MAVVLESALGTLEVHDDLVLAACDCATAQADLVGLFLQKVGALQRERAPDAEAPGFSAAFLLELGAALQLLVWELDGLRELGKLDLPTATEAAAAVQAATEVPTNAACTSKASPLGCIVLRTWLEKFSWTAPAMLGANIVMGDVDEDQLVEALATLLWENREHLR